jgi:hypothetical protein
LRDGALVYVHDMASFERVLNAQIAMGDIIELHDDDDELAEVVGASLEGSEIRLDVKHYKPLGDGADATLVRKIVLPADGNIRRERQD